MKKLVVGSSALGLTVLAASAQSQITSLPFDVTYLTTCITTPTNAALVVGIGFGAVFILWQYVKRSAKPK